jgi:hypothetical protein
VRIHAVWSSSILTLLILGTLVARFAANWKFDFQDRTDNVHAAKAVFRYLITSNTVRPMSKRAFFDRSVIMGDHDNLGRSGEPDSGRGERAKRALPSGARQLQVDRVWGGSHTQPVSLL